MAGAKVNCLQPAGLRCRGARWWEPCCGGRGRIEIEREAPAPFCTRAARVGETAAWAGGEELSLRTARVRPGARPTRLSGVGEACVYLQTFP